MPAYIYTARSKTGEKSEGNVQASDRRSALALLQGQGLVPISVKEGGDAPAPKAKSKTKAKTKKPAAKKAKSEKLYAHRATRRETKNETARDARVYPRVV